MINQEEKEREKNALKYMAKHNYELFILRFDMCFKPKFIDDNKNAPFSGYSYNSCSQDSGDKAIIIDKEVYQIKRDFDNFNQIKLYPIPLKYIRGIWSPLKNSEVSEVEKKIIETLKEKKSKFNLEFSIVKKEAKN